MEESAQSFTQRLTEQVSQVLRQRQQREEAAEAMREW